VLVLGSDASARVLRTATPLPGLRLGGPTRADSQLSLHWLASRGAAALQQERQLPFVFNSESALATYMATHTCPAELGYSRVNGDTWTATTHV